MSVVPRVLLIRPADVDPATIDALRTGIERAGAEVIDLVAGPGRRAAVATARAARRITGVGAVITVSPPGDVHLAGAVLARRGIPWIAHLGPGWQPPAPDRWRRALDPRLRALRRALLVTTWDQAGAERVSRELAVIVSALHERDGDDPAARSLLDPVAPA